MNSDVLSIIIQYLIVDRQSFRSCISVCKLWKSVCYKLKQFVAVTPYEVIRVVIIDAPEHGIFIGYPFLNMESCYHGICVHLDNNFRLYHECGDPKYDEIIIVFPNIDLICLKQAISIAGKYLANKLKPIPNAIRKSETAGKTYCPTLQGWKYAMESRGIKADIKIYLKLLHQVIVAEKETFILMDLNGTDSLPNLYKQFINTLIGSATGNYFINLYLELREELRESFLIDHFSTRV